MFGGEKMDLYNKIAKVAYELYEKNGCLCGRDLEHWLEAEKIVMARLAEQEKKKEKGRVTSEKKPTAKTKKTAVKKTK
jgi:hypothetical protein